MTRKHIHTYFLDQMVAFEVNLIESAFNSEKAIHQLRVSIKKLRTLLGLIQEFSPFPEKYQYRFKRITSIFKPLGAIRDNRNKVKMIEYYFSNEIELKEKLIADLNKRWTLAQKHYIGKYQEFSLDSFFRFKIEFGFYLETQSKQIHDQAIFKNRYDQINDLMDQNNLRENLHKIRSFVKELLFLLQISKKEQMSFNGNTYLTNDLASLGELIGQWHDYELLINLYKRLEDELHEETTNEFLSVVQKSDELFDFVSEKLHSQFNNS